MQTTSHSGIFKILILTGFLLIEKSAEAHGENYLVIIAAGFFSVFLFHLSVFLWISRKIFFHLALKNKIAILVGLFFLFLVSTILVSMLGNLLQSDFFGGILTLVLPFISTIIFAKIINKR